MAHGLQSPPATKEVLINSGLLANPKSRKNGLIWATETLVSLSSREAPLTIENLKPAKQRRGPTWAPPPNPMSNVKRERKSS